MRGALTVGALWLLTSCTDARVAKTHVFDDPNAAAVIPERVVPATATSPELAYFRVDGSRLAGLRESMTAALSPPLREDGSRGVNARILLNLDEQTRSTLTPQSAEEGGCWSGLEHSSLADLDGDGTAETPVRGGNGCLRLLDSPGGGGTDIRLLDFDPPEEGLFHPQYDSRVTDLGIGQDVFHPLRSLERLARPALAQASPVSLGPAIDTLADFMPLRTTPGADSDNGLANNAAIDIRFVPEEIGFGTPSGAKSPGLYLPIDLTFTGGTWAQEHTCGAGFDDARLCPQIRSQLKGYCAVGQFSARINHLRVYLVLSPSIIPGCVDPAGNSTADNTSSAWRRHLPFSEPFRQGCLQFETDFGMDTDNEVITLASSSNDAIRSTADVAFWASASSCNDGVELVCSAIDCPAEIRERARAIIRKRLQTQLSVALKPQIDKYLRTPDSYRTAPATGAFAVGLPPFCSVSPLPMLGTNESTAQSAARAAACAARAQLDLVPASLDRLVFGFFANAFRGMPIVDVQPCSVGLQADAPAINPFTACCPPGSHAYMDGYCAPGLPPPLSECPANFCDAADANDPKRDACCGLGHAVAYSQQRIQSATYFVVQRDVDRDGIPGNEDLCPFVSAEGAIDLDSDGDGFGDACDACKCSPRETYADDDGDGVCTEPCPGALADNCPAVPNKDQRNINQDAELYSRNGPEEAPALSFGDACEPVPTPEFSVAASPYDAPGSGCQLVTRGVESCTETVANDAIAFTPQGPHATGEHTGQLGSGEASMEGITTEAFFCVPALGRPCDAASVSGRDGLAGQASDTEPGAVFRFARLRPAAGGLPSSVLPLFTYHKAGKAGRSLVWDVAGDLKRWRSASWGAGIPDPQQIAVGPRPEPGRFWLHASAATPLPGYAAQSSASDAMFGRHGVGFPGTARFPAPRAEENLANVYWGGWPVDAVKKLRLIKYLEKKSVLAVPPCVTCAQPSVDDLASGAGCLACSIGRSPTDGRSLVIPMLIDPVDQLALAVDGRGAFRDATASLSPRALAALVAPHRLASATDVFPTSEAAAPRPIAVLVRPDGTGVLDTLFGGTLSLGTKADVVRRVAARAVAAVSTTQPAMAPPASSSFVATYSRERGSLFLAQARASQTDGTVWVFDVEAEAWSRLPLGGVRLDTPIAAVYLPQTDTLWVLDETRVGFVKFARLVRIRRSTGSATVMASYPRLGLYDTHYLLEDRDGGLLVAASSRLLNHHVLVKLSDAATITAFGFGKVALEATPLVDPERYTFFLRQAGAGPLARSVPELGLTAGRSVQGERCY
jgi:hypothetical protein